MMFDSYGHFSIRQFTVVSVTMFPLSTHKQNHIADGARLISFTITITFVPSEEPEFVPSLEYDDQGHCMNMYSLRFKCRLGEDFRDYELIWHRFKS